MADNLGKHICQCGCGGVIEIKIHHHTRGIPSFLNHHASRIVNGMSGMYGSLNPNYHGGKHTNQSGYVVVLIPGPGRSKYRLEHRIVMEESLGRELEDHEQVHHINGIKHDNRLENLELTNNVEHSRHHAIIGETGTKLLIKRGYVRCGDGWQLKS